MNEITTEIENTIDIINDKIWNINEKLKRKINLTQEEDYILNIIYPIYRKILIKMLEERND